MNHVSRVLILFGLLTLLFGVYLVFERYNPKRLEFNNIEFQTINAQDRFPKEIIIPALKIQLAVYPAQIKNKRWEATAKGISYLVTSSVPGEQGNSILYGHNWSSLLGSLPKIKPGDKIIVKLDDNQTKTFVVKYTSIVSPDQTDILKDTSDSRITLYTCVGFLDSKRFVVTALLKESLVHKINLEIN